MNSIKTKLYACWLVLTGRSIYCVIRPPKDGDVEVYTKVNTHPEAVLLLQVALKIEEKITTRKS